MKKLVSYLPFAALFILPLLFYPGIDTFRWKSSSDVHALLEFASSLLAVTAGIMVLLHFFTTGRWFFLTISIGFVLIGTEEFVHAIFSFDRIYSETHSTFKLAVSTTWLTGHFILLTSFFLALIFRDKEIAPAKRAQKAVVYILISLVGAASIALFIFYSPFLPQFVQIGSSTKKQIELFLALLFFVAFLFYSKIYMKQQSRSPLLWSIIACIIFHMVAHIFVFDAHDFYDAHWDTAHVLVLLSYFFPILGVWGETIKIYRSIQLRIIEVAKEMTERKRVEEELKTSEEKYHSIFENIQDVYFETLLDGTILEISPSIVFVSYGQYHREDLIGRSMYDFYSNPDDRISMLVEMQETGRINDYEVRFKNRDGSIITCSMSLKVKLSVEGRPEKIIGSMHDISERKRTEAELHTAGSFLDRIINAIADPVFVKDEKRRFVLVNDSLCAIIGRPREDILGKDDDDLFPEEQVAVFKKGDSDVLDNGEENVNEEFLSNLSSGEIRTIVTRKTRYIDPVGKKFLVGVIRDITERKRAEEDLKKSEERFKLIFEYAPDAFYLCDLKGDFIAGNKAAEKITGFEREELIGGSFLKLSLLSLDQLPKAAALLAKNVIGKSTGPDEFILKRKDGEKVLVEISTHPVKFEKRTLVLGIARDITERKRVEKQIALLAHTLKSVTECVSITDMNDIVLFVNNAFLKTYGYTENEILGKNISIVRSPNNHPKATSSILAATLAGGWNGELMNRTKEGRDFPVSLSTSFVRNEQGQDIALVGIATDITERKQAEEELKNSEDRYRSIFENVQDVYYETLLDGTILEVSPSIEVISKGQYHRADVIGRSMYEFYPDANTRDTLIETIQKAGSVTDFEVRLKNRDDSFITSSISAKMIFNADGQPEKIIGSMHDISMRKQAEERLSRLNQQHDLILSSAAEGILGIDSQGNHTFVNPAAARMLGYEIEELLNHPSHSAWHHTKPDGSPYPKEECNINAAYRDGAVHRSFTEVFWRKDGTSFPVEYTSTPIIEQDQLMGAVVTFSDITERKRAEEALRETTDYLDNLLSFANAPIIVWDNNNRITKFNLAFERLTKYTIFDVIGKHPEILFPVETRKDLSALISRTSDGENLMSVEMPIRCKDGSVRIVLWNTTNIYSADGKVIIATIAHGQDITKRKHAEEELSESETRYRSVLQSATDAIITADSRGIIVGWNSGAERIFGYNYTEAAGHSLTSLMPLYHQATHTSGMERILSGGDQHVIGKTVELEGLRKDKSVFPIELSLSTWESKSGHFFTGIIRDITERKRAGELIQESELRFRSLYENATIGLYRTTPDGNILMANPTLVKLLGYTSFQKLAERNLEKDGFEPSYRRKEFLQKIERDGEINGNESKWTRPDGTVVYVLESARAIRDSQGNTMYYDGTVEDITNHRQLEEQMRQLQKLESLGTLAGGIAHDFNNILGIILAYTTTINRVENNPKKLDRAVDTIVKAVQRGTTLVRQILTFARKSETEFRLISINEVVKEVIGMILETFPRTLSYSQNLQEDIPAVNADRSQIHQALLNLCVNARDAMPDGGVLTMNTSTVDGITLHKQHPDALAGTYVCIEISDTGEGMTEEVRMRIFEPFFTTKEEGKGTGLGLAVVFGVVRTHKGFVEVDSERGKGTTFLLYLPVPSEIAPVIKEIQEIAKEIPGGTETLFVVEDEEMLMTFNQISLAAKGYTVISAVDGPEAVQIYREQHKEINLVFTDLGLPGMTGLEEINIIKKINPDAKIIVATGYLNPETKSELLKAGVKKFILKPYDFEKILLIVREVLDEK